MAKPVERVVEPFEYILPADLELPADQQTIFTFRPMKQRERLAVLDDSGTISFQAGERRINDRTYQQGYEIVLAHLEKVQNFPPGAPVDWPKTEAERIKYLERLSDIDIMLLGNAVIQRSILHDMEKNS